MHQALYRKWRPSTFDQVCGQPHITSVLKQECADGTVSHAYLFCGSRGTGKTSCAKILAKAVNCEHPAGGNPCGKCPSCAAIEAGTATDVLEMDAASNNGVDTIRDIREEVVYTPSMLKYRVYIVDEVHMLSGSAFNALLKTLEEPPSHVIFILATTELQKLPATIISRCQRFEFRRIATPVITERLLEIASAEAISLDREAASLIAKLAQGGMRDAVSLLELCAGARGPITTDSVTESVGISSRDTVARLVQAIHDKAYDTLFGAIAEIVASSRDLTVLWQDLIAFYRDMLVMQTAPADARRYLDLTETEMTATQALASLFSKETLLYHTKLLENALLTMQKAGTIRRYEAEMTLVRLCDASLDTSSEALLARIAALEDTLATQMVSGTPAVHVPVVVTEEVVPAPHGEAAPGNASASVAPSKEVKPKRALPYWPEAVDKICRNDPSLAGFLRHSKTYKTDSGTIVVRLESPFAVQMLRARPQTTDNFLTVLSFYEKRTLTAGELLFEVSHEHDISDPAAEGLDEILQTLDHSDS